MSKPNPISPIYNRNSNAIKWSLKTYLQGEAQNIHPRTNRPKSTNNIQNPNTHYKEQKESYPILKPWDGRLHRMMQWRMVVVDEWNGSGGEGKKMGRERKEKKSEKERKKEWVREREREWNGKKKERVVDDD